MIVGDVWNVSGEGEGTNEIWEDDMIREMDPEEADSKKQ